MTAPGGPGDGHGPLDVNGALDPEPVIDCHAHVGRFRGYDLDEETLLANLRRHGIALALVSNIDGAAVEGRTADVDEEEANARAEAVVRRHPRLLRGLLWCRPTDGSARALEPFLDRTIDGGGWTRRLFVGLKLHPEMNHFPADDPAVDPYMVLARREALPVVVHCDGSVEDASAERIFALARRHPDVPVVLYHMGMGGPHGPAIEAAREARRAGSALLHLETAQADPAAVLEAVERVGADRVLFGTDATYFGRHHYEEYRTMLERMRHALGADDRRRILYENALSLFRLGAGPGVAA